MRLIRCHIENFGTCSDLSVSFDQQLHLINEENGWGKSTLAAFIKVMFYGFANEGKRNVVDNERKKYKPWQKGIYGGQLVFETKGRQYEIIRSFGNKEKEDQFALYDAQTNLESDLFTQKIGEELFQIDQESFCRSIFFAQKDCVTCATDRISAKIGNLAENTDDINNYETVLKKLTDSLNKMSPSKRTGTLYKLKNEQTAMEQRLRSVSVLEETMEQLQQKIQQEIEQKEQQKQQQLQIQTELQKASQFREQQAKLETYERICRQLQEWQEKARIEKTSFPHQEPEEETFTKRLQQARQLVRLQTAMEQLVLSEDEQLRLEQFVKVFGEHVPEQQQLEQQKAQAQQLTRVRLAMAEGSLSEEEEKQLKQLNHCFPGQIPSEEEVEKQIKQWKQYRRLCEEWERSRIDAESRQREYSSGKTRRLPVLAGVVLILAGLVLLAFLPPLGLVLLAAGAVLTFLAGRMRRREGAAATDRSSMEQQLEEQHMILQEALQRIKWDAQKMGLPFEEETFLEQLYQLKTRIPQWQRLRVKQQTYEEQHLQEQYERLNQSLRQFLQNYVSVDEVQMDQFLTQLQKLEQWTDEYGRLRQKLRSWQQTQATCEKDRQELCGYVQSLGVVPQENLLEQLQQIKERWYSYLQSCREIARYQREKTEFENSNELTVEENSNQTVGQQLSLEELNAQLRTVTAALEQQNEHLLSYRRQADSLQEQLNELDEVKQQKIELEEKMEQMADRYEVYEQTRACLENAKESLTARYMRPIMSGFVHYYQMLTGKLADTYRIDANMNLTMMEAGELREVNLLSTGCQDLVGICMRMALIEAMYREEKPFLIVDDPFVNLDDAKVNRGLQFLKSVSSEYQILYFTCHQSRE